MAKVDVLNAGGKKAGSVELPEEIFGVQVNVPVMHRVVRAQLAAARAGTHSTKTRAEVRGGGKKPWRQKGTGRARQGSIRAPQWRGGGVVFGPTPRDHSLRVNKKEKVLALRSALTDRHAGGNLVVLDGLDFDTPKTARAVELLEEPRARRAQAAVRGRRPRGGGDQELPQPPGRPPDHLRPAQHLRRAPQRRRRVHPRLPRRLLWPVHHRPAAEEELVLEEGDAK